MTEPNVSITHPSFLDKMWEEFKMSKTKNFKVYLSPTDNFKIGIQIKRRKMFPYFSFFQGSWLKLIFTRAFGLINMYLGNSVTKAQCYQIYVRNLQTRQKNYYVIKQHIINFL